ncbi:MAG: NFACT family protein [Flavonifractor plautii]
MPLDALCLTAVAAELRAAVAGGKIDKLYQPTRDEVVLYVRGRGRTCACSSPPTPAIPGPT